MILKRLQDSSLTVTAKASPSWSSSTIPLAAHSNWMYLLAWWLSNKFGVSNNKSSWNQAADAATCHTRTLQCSSLGTPLGIAAPSKESQLRTMSEFPWILELTFILAERVHSTKMLTSSFTTSGPTDWKSYFKKSQTRPSEILLEITKSIESETSSLKWLPRLSKILSKNLRPTELSSSKSVSSK